MLRNFKPRLYQETILDTCIKENTLVVLPTGMGKTSIALMLSMHRLKHFPKSKVLVLAPTRPLAEQHKSSFLKHTCIDEGSMAVFTGFVSPQKRQELWSRSKIIFSTPQGLENDMISGRISLEDVSLLVFDEAHRAVGDYSYAFIAKQYKKKAKYPRILGLTASPGSELEKINEVCSNLYIDDVEIRSQKDPDVKPYIQDVKINWVEVSLPHSFRAVQKYLNESFNSKIKEINKHGFLNEKKRRFIGKTDLLRLQGELHSEVSKGNKDFSILKSISLAAEAMKVQHALELLETQGITSLHRYMEGIIESSVKTSTKAVKNLAADANFKSAFIKAKSLYEAGVEHPKLEELKRIAEKENAAGVKLLIFTQFRDSASKIEEKLSSIKGIRAKTFFGQAKKGTTGMSQKKQKELIEEFSSGGFNVMVATSVAEEGLDIPKVDVVIFYEPIPSAIRHIQRKGRTGRLEKGKVYVLFAKGTRDEGYRWSAFHKEKRMEVTLKDLKKKFLMNNIEEKREENENRLDSFFGKKAAKDDGQEESETIRIFADDREKGSGVMRELVDRGVNISLKRLETGDFVLSGRCAAEYKRVPDFVDSIVDGRLLQQVRALKSNYEKPVLIVEGQEDIYSQRNVHPNAVRGMLATVAVSYGVPVLQTRDFRETASLLAVIAKREQEETGKGFSVHNEKKHLTLKEQQEYIISSLPGVGSTLARPMLKSMGSVRNVINASPEEMQSVEKIGKKKAEDIHRVLNDDYDH